MRTILLTVLALGACTSPPQAPPAPPMPSALLKEVVDSTVPSTAAACVTRYSWPQVGLQFDCPTEHVGGDPFHWVMSCAIPADFDAQRLHALGSPPVRYEASSDETGHLLHE